MHRLTNVRNNKPYLKWRNEEVGAHNLFYLYNSLQKVHGIRNPVINGILNYIIFHPFWVIYLKSILEDFLRNVEEEGILPAKLLRWDVIDSNIICARRTVFGIYEWLLFEDGDILFVLHSSVSSRESWLYGVYFNKFCYTVPSVEPLSIRLNSKLKWNNRYFLASGFFCSGVLLVISKNQLVKAEYCFWNILKRIRDCASEVEGMRVFSVVIYKYQYDSKHVKQE